VLATQLGYPAEAAEVALRLAPISVDAGAGLLVAADASDQAIGWLHVQLKHSLMAPPAAQVMGLVIDESQRSAGIGGALLEAAEAWALDRGCTDLLVATRITRERAHAFYRRHGYALLKTSHMFTRRLSERA
jgi:GNAT superfamily N-acetyltransferase